MVPASSVSFLFDVQREGGGREEEGKWTRKKGGKEGFFFDNKQKFFP